MRLITFAILLGCLASATALPQTPAEKELLDLDAKWYGAFLKSDAKTMNQIEGDDMMVITAGTFPSRLRPVHKSRTMKKRSPSTREQMAATNRSIDKVTIRFVGDVGILNAIQTETSKDVLGKEQVQKAFMTAVWARRAGQWELINAQWTDIAETDFSK